MFPKVLTNLSKINSNLDQGYGVVQIPTITDN